MDKIMTVVVRLLVGLTVVVALFVTVLTTRLNTQRLNELASEIVEIKKNARLMTCYGNDGFRVCDESVVDKSKMDAWICNGFGECVLKNKADAN